MLPQQRLRYSQLLLLLWSICLLLALVRPRAEVHKLGFGHAYVRASRDDTETGPCDASVISAGVCASASRRHRAASMLLPRQRLHRSARCCQFVRHMSQQSDLSKPWHLSLRAHADLPGS